MKENTLHINVKEILAIYYALRSFCLAFMYSHTKVFSDNTTSVYTINKMGSSKSLDCNRVVRDIWEFCRTNHIWITCAHIPGAENKEADEASRKLYRDAEWMLNPELFSQAVHYHDYLPDIDLFASRLNAQVDTYVSHKPDPFATFVDAFTLNWTHFNSYIFPPFSLIPRILQKLEVDEAEAMIVVPYWPTQVWYTKMLHMLVGKPMFVQPHIKNLVPPNKPRTKHLLWEKLTLIIGFISGKNSSVKVTA